MSLVKAECPQFGATIQVDNTKEAGICQYCGTAFITEKAISNYSIVNNTTIQNAIFNVTKTLDEIELETIYIAREYDVLTEKMEVLVDEKVYATIDNGEVIELKIEKNSHHRIQFALGNEKSNVLFLEKGEIINIKVTIYIKKVDLTSSITYYGLKLEKTHETFNELKEKSDLKRQKVTNAETNKKLAIYIIVFVIIFIFIIVMFAASMP